MVVLGLGSFIYWEQKERVASEAEDLHTSEMTACSDAMKHVRGRSLVISNNSVRIALECAERHAEFRAFKDLYDERSPDSPNRKPYDPDYWPNFP